GAAQDAGKPGPVGRPVGDRGGAGVGGDHHQRTPRQVGGDQAVDGGRGGVHDQGQGARVPGGHAVGEGGGGQRIVQGGRAGGGPVEAIAGRACGVDVHDGERGGRVG